MFAVSATGVLWPRPPAATPKTGFYAFYEQWRARREINGRIPWDAYRTARENIDRIKVPEVANLRWEQIGAFNLQAPFQKFFGQGPLGGRVNAVAYHPQNPNILYAGLATGGLWRSGDGGKTWTCLSRSWPVQSVSRIVIDPVLPNRIYVGTGDTHGDMARSCGIMRSVDSGATWMSFLSAPSELGDVGINSLVVIPTNRNVLLASGTTRAGDRAGLYRSTNWGSTWTLVDNSVQVQDLEFASQNIPRTQGTPSVYGLFASGGVVFIASSKDLGATWNGPAHILASWRTARGADLAVSKNNPNVVYVLSGVEKRIVAVDFKVPDKPVEMDLTAGFVSGGWGQAADYNWSQGDYNYHLTVMNNRGGEELYVGQIDLVWTVIVKSASGLLGADWYSLGGPSYWEGSLIHNDQHSMAGHPTNPDEALVGNDGGLFRMTWTGGINGVSYQSLNANLPTQMFVSGAFHPNHPGIMLGGTQDNATPVARGNLKAWSNVSGGDGGQAAIHPKNPLVQFATAQYGQIYWTTNGWATVAGNTKVPYLANEDKPFTTPIAIHPTNPALLFTAGRYVYRFNTTTRTWTSRLGNYQLGGKRAASAIELAPSVPNCIYVGGPNMLDMSVDGGKTWRSFLNPASAFKAVADIAVHPTNANWILVAVNHATFGPCVYQCKNTAVANPTWTRLAVGLPQGVAVNSVSFDPSAASTTFYAGTDLGVYRTVNAGASWENISRPHGMPNVQVNTVEAVPGTGYLMAATFGQGMWRLPLTNLPADRIKSVTVSPRTIKIGEAATATITLSEPAPASGYGLSLSTNKTWATVPPYAIIEAGKTTATFTVSTKKPASYPTSETAAVYADLGMQRKIGLLTANP